MFDEKMHFKKLKKLIVKLQCSFFSLATLFFRSQRTKFFFFKKFCQIKAGQKNKWNIEKTLGLVQVCRPTTFQNPKMLDKSNVQVPKTLAQGKLHFLESLCINTNSSNDISTKVMHSKYSKHWPYLLAYRTVVTAVKYQIIVQIMGYLFFKFLWCRFVHSKLNWKFRIKI